MKIIVEPKLQRESVEALLAGEAGLVRVPDFYLRESRDLLARVMQNTALLGRYANAPDIWRIGEAFYEKQASPEAARNYTENALAWMAQIREAVSPMQSPVDKLRLELDEIWPAGATLAKIDDEKAFCGLFRIFPERCEALPHQDVLAWDLPDGHPDGCLSSQLATNVYLKLPPRGGELAIWATSLNRTEYERRRRPDSYGLDVADLGAPAILVRPEPGELMMFNSRLVHAVRPALGGERISMSCFLGFRGADEPAWMWS